MKYVRPCILFYEMHKKAMELAGKKAVGPQLLGLNVLEKYVTISISDPTLLIAIHYGIVERERRKMHTIANLFRTLIPRYNLEGAVIGCPDAGNTDNLEVAKVKSFVEDLCNTRKLEGLKYTYWDKRFAPATNSIRMEHDEGIEVYDNELSSVFILQISKTKVEGCFHLLHQELKTSGGPVHQSTDEVWMSTLDADQTSNQRKDPAWRYFIWDWRG